jgi:hypothetical protein
MWAWRGAGKNAKRAGPSGSTSSKVAGSKQNLHFKIYIVKLYSKII